MSPHLQELEPGWEMNLRLARGVVQEGAQLSWVLQDGQEFFTWRWRRRAFQAAVTQA